MKRTPRLYLSPACFSENGVALGKPERHYLSRVLRKSSGAEFCAMDGLGRAWLCRLTEKGVSPRVGDYPAVAPLPRQLHFGIALCKPNRFEDAVEKLAELGVASVTPIVTERVDNASPSPNKLRRLHEIAQSASALSFRSVPLEVRDSTSLGDFVEGSCNILFAHPGGKEAGSLFAEGATEQTILIGPEGGFSDSEVSYLLSRGEALCLGPLNLRVATAATTAAALALNWSK